MLTSLAIIFLSGLALSAVFQKLRMPGLLGMLLAGVLLSPHAFNLLDSSILDLSSDLRRIALVIILTRAGLGLSLGELKKVGRPAFLLCFVPACFEILGVVLLAPKLLGVTTLEAAIMGAVVAAVSPAVIVPRMLKLIEEGRGKKNSIPQMLMAGASVDDVFVIVLFTSFTTLAQGGTLSAVSFFTIPISIITGILGGLLSGLVFMVFLKKTRVRDSVTVILLLSLSFLLLALETAFEKIPFSGFLAVMTMGAAMRKKDEALAKRISAKFGELWTGAELLLFVLVGVTVDVRYAAAAGIWPVLVIVGALVFRMAGVYCCVIKTQLTGKERLFSMLAYLPKATVQAAIGSIPLSMGLPCGQMVLTVAVLAILITAPMGALGIDLTYEKLLDES